MRLSAEYARCSEQLADILELKTKKWLEIRQDVKSDTSADRRWDATEEGIHEMRLKLKMKAMEKEMSSIKTFLDVLNAEARNII
jgi:hypothetical protein